MLLLWRCIATLNDILAISIGRGFQGTQKNPALIHWLTSSHKVVLSTPQYEQGKISMYFYTTQEITKYSRELWFRGRLHSWKKCQNTVPTRTLSLSQWNLIIGSGRIVEYKIDTKITLSDDVNQKNIPAKFASIRPWSFSEEEWR